MPSGQVPVTIRSVRALARTRFRLPTAMLAVLAIVATSTVGGLTYRVCRITQRVMLECCCAAQAPAPEDVVRAPCCCDLHDTGSLPNATCNAEYLSAAAHDPVLVAVAPPALAPLGGSPAVAFLRSRDGPRRLHLVLERHLI